ncbi:hypothetical protein [Parasitella parasitica]|uniref:CMP/dCMP-type deaminase domain-containing protein n=1 Tax=Parasitella parasitica TaxID=35722 RepID=A0A0B7NSH3_9FUNG|nr:hypothetical protein [Parasitella parasitica]
MNDPHGTPYTNNASDLKYMKESIQEANKSIPAPLAYCVGAVLVGVNGEVLGRGFSRELEGNTHAEECALAKAEQDGKNTEGATMYSTMEPCSRRLSGNRSCTSRIIEAKIKRVVIGAREPPDLVNCEGISLLEKEGIQVFIVPEVEEECLKPNQHILKKQ